MPLAPLMVALVACGTGAAQEEGNTADATLAASVSGPSAYVILATGNMDRGWNVLDAMDAELPASQRAKIQTRGLVSGASRDMMIRFAGECGRDDGFVAAVRAVAGRYDVRQVRCTPTLPTS